MGEKNKSLFSSSSILSNLFSQPDNKFFSKTPSVNTKFNQFSQLSSSRDHLLRGHNSSLSFSGSGFLGPDKMMSVQEIAQSHQIMAQVMKNNLYQSVVAPRTKRRYSTTFHGNYDIGNTYRRPESVYSDVDYQANRTNMEIPNFDSWRSIQSLPVTPCQSPSASRKRLCLENDSTKSSLQESSYNLNSIRKYNLSRSSLRLREEHMNFGIESVLKQNNSVKKKVISMYSNDDDDDERRLTKYRDGKNWV